MLQTHMYPHTHSVTDTWTLALCSQTDFFYSPLNLFLVIKPC